MNPLSTNVAMTTLYDQLAVRQRDGDAVTPIAVSVVNHNTRDLLRACLEALIAEAPNEIVIVDNASTDGSVAMVRSEFPQARLVTNDVNRGYGAAANQALAECSAPYVLLLNSDTCVQPGALKALCRFLDAHPDAAVVGPRLSNSDGTLQPSSFPFPTPFQLLVEQSSLGRRICRIPVLREHYLQTWSYAEARSVPWVMGAALVIRQEAIRSVCGFDESYFMYFEEVDLCHRLAATGWRVYYCPCANIVHVGGASTKQQRSDMYIQFYASLGHFYHQHYSYRASIQLLGLVKSAMLIRWIRDLIRLRLTSDAQQRSRLVEDIRAWRLIYSGRRERE